jgi:hypothetical protein
MNFHQIINTVIAAFLIGVGSAFFAGFTHLTSIDNRLSQMERQYSHTVTKNSETITDHGEKITATASQQAVHDSRLKTLEELYLRSVVRNREAVADHATRLSVLELHTKLNHGNGGSGGVKDPAGVKLENKSTQKQDIVGNVPLALIKELEKVISLEKLN